MDDQIHQPCFQRATMSHEPKIEKVDGKTVAREIPFVINYPASYLGI